MKIKSLGSVLAQALRRRGRAGSRPGPSDARRRRLAAGAHRLPGREARAQGRVDGVEVRTLTDGGQPAEDTAQALADFLGAAQQTLEIAIYDLNLPPDLQTIVVGAIEDARQARRRRPPRVQRRPPQDGPGAAAAAARSGGRRGAPVPDGRDPGHPRPHAPQVRDPRPGVGVDGLDELDGRLVDARGERRRHRRLARARRPLRRRLRAAVDARATSSTAARSTPSPRRQRRPRLVLPGPRRAARAPDREGDRHGDAARAHRVARDLVGPDPRHARAGRLRREGRRRRRRRPDAGARGAPAVARERQRVVEGAAAAHVAHEARRSRASARRRTGPAPCTTTCTRR